MNLIAELLTLSLTPQFCPIWEQANWFNLNSNFHFIRVRWGNKSVEYVNGGKKTNLWDWLFLQCSSWELRALKTVLKTSIQAASVSLLSLRLTSCSELFNRRIGEDFRWNLIVAPHHKSAKVEVYGRLQRDCRSVCVCHFLYRSQMKSHRHSCRSNLFETYFKNTFLLWVET